MTINRVFGSLIASSPSLRRSLWRGLYQFLAGSFRNEDWTFMNYGFGYPEGGEAGAAAAPALDAADEPDRCSIQLYHRVVGAVDVQGARVLEVGSGRGGGSAYIARYHRPAAMLGIDYSDSAVALSRKRHTAPGLDFQQGDAEALPCADASFDAVVNVESSHCYGSMDGFLGEVSRVLRPGGHLLWADLRPRENLDLVREQFRRAGLEICHEEDITQHVLLGLDQVHERKRATIARHVPSFMRRPFEDFAGVRGSRVYESLRDGRTLYWRCTLRKPDAAAAAPQDGD